jgi:hypothetical protein
MDAPTGTRLATILMQEAHAAAARDRRYRPAPTSASDGRRLARAPAATKAAGVATVVAALALLLAGCSPAAAVGQLLQAGPAGPVVHAGVSPGLVEPADPPAKARPGSHGTSPTSSGAIPLLAAAAVGAAIVGGIAASTRRAARKDEPRRAGGRVAPGGSIPAN